MRRIIRLTSLAFGLYLAAIVPAGATCVGLDCTCTAASAAVAFGTYNPINGAAVDAVGNVSVTCSSTVLGATIAYEIALSPGLSGDQSARAMMNGATPLAYNLYVDAARTTVWGDGIGGTATVANSYTLLLLQPQADDFPVYGRLFGLQNVGVGSYADTIVATVTY